MRLGVEEALGWSSRSWWGGGAGRAVGLGHCGAELGTWEGGGGRGKMRRKGKRKGDEEKGRKMKRKREEK